MYTINKNYFGSIINDDIKKYVNYVLNHPDYFSSDDLKFIRYYIIEHEPNFRYDYPIVPYSLNADKIMIISDTHIGHKTGNIDYLNWAYQEAQFYKINKVFIAGDVFEGIIEKTLQEVNIDEIKKYYGNNYYFYLQEMAKKFPNINGIETKILLGNHDISMIFENMISTIDLMKLYESIPNSELLGIGKVYINWNAITNNTNCRFILNHDISTIHFSNHNYDKENITISGHHHYYAYNENEIYLPTLSTNRSFNPGLIIMELNNNSLITKQVHKINVLNITANDIPKTLILK